MSRFIVACGGTGGHVYPGLAVAQALRRRGHEVAVWFSGRAIEAYARDAWDGPAFKTGARRLHPKWAFHLLLSWLRCRREMRRYQPAALLAMGSYSSLPPVLAAQTLGVPVVLHEANAIPGKAVRRLAKRPCVKEVALSFPASAEYLPGVKTVCTGFPLRRTLIEKLLTPGELPVREDGAFTVLVTGGSQGAHAVNELACEAFCRMAAAGCDTLRVIHQSGAADVEALQNRYAEFGVKAEVAAYIRDMGKAYAAADAVVARAGASTCFELCLCAVPALLIPLPSAMNDHQTLNAKMLVEKGGALAFNQKEMTAQNLIDVLLQMRSDPEITASMRRALASLADPDADEHVADRLESVIQRKNT